MKREGQFAVRKGDCSVKIVKGGMDMYSIGIDLGGTNIVAGVVSKEGDILSKGTLPTPRDIGDFLPLKVAKTMVEAVGIALDQGEFDLEKASCIGIGAPGTINPETKTIGYWSNLEFKDVPMGQLISECLEKKYSKIPPIYLENDANAAALGEFYAGAGKKGNSLVALTLGTGVGGGAVINGKLLTGFNYAGLEVGHFVLKSGGKPCSCGRLGCFEAYSSATALIRQTKKAMEENKSSLLWELVEGDSRKVNGKTAFDGSLQGDFTAKSVVEEYIYFLASGVTSLINLLQPEILCIGGGVSGQKENLLLPLLEIIDKEDYARHLERRTKVVLAELGNNAGVIGAAMLPEYQ